MKSAMETYVNEARNTMFEQACREVQKRLNEMSEELRKSLLDRAEGVFSSMKRDYMSLVDGVDLGHVQIPRGERAAKRELDEVINLMDEEFRKVAEADLESLRKSDEGDGLEEVFDDLGTEDEDVPELEGDEDLQGESQEGSEADDAFEPAPEPMEVEDED